MDTDTYGNNYRIGIHCTVITRYSFIHLLWYAHIRPAGRRAQDTGTTKVPMNLHMGCHYDSFQDRA